MPLVQISGPAVPPVSLIDIKAHLRVEHDEDDAYLENLAAAAASLIESACRKALITQKWRLLLDSWPDSLLVELPKAPVQAVTAVTVYDANDAPVEIAAENWITDLASEPARLLARFAPFSYRTLNGYEIDFTCGYGDGSADIPGELIQAILAITAHWYEFRGAPGDPALGSQLPAGIDRLLVPFRSLHL